ncbi:hypothetical protein GCM10009837_20100 [Streptomyces durmitorensis]|uniref:WXG100 family type VII secretion target n=1 Tax=Streptomyces durmitorensis TaxID=319947 RepID=A0ABY4PQV5_9ACTN|nr:hypothetical protein [Streptomyces durmitorensis]UQT55333.1 hypothetical protein M4V62_09610 [Streptomyces durmitorensis]
MRYDQERAQEPVTTSAESAKQRAPQTPGAEPARAPHQSGISAVNSGQTPTEMLITQGDRDKMTMRLQQALSTFVENPHQAVQEADSVFEEAATHLTDVLTERRHTLRASWQGPGTETQTEELRLALRQYQETTERLLRI